MADKFDDLIEDFKKDSTKENEGVWMTFKRHQFLVARSHRDNKDFQKLMEERMRPYQFAIDRGNLSALKEVANEVLQGVYAETVLKGIRKLDGTVLEYDGKTDGVKLFSELPDLWDAVFAFAKADDNYSPDSVLADSGN